MKKIISMILSVLLLLTLLCGCGGSAKSASYDAASPAYREEMGKSYASGGSGWAADAPMAMAPESAKAEAESSSYNGAEPVRTGSNLPANVKLIYRANIDMESTEFDKAVQGLNDLVERLGGYFETSELDNYSNYRHGIYTVRLPAENFDTFCGAVGDICQVNNLSRSAEDISELYYDTESRLVTQQTKLARLQELLRQAEDMEDIITLESAISETELAIENLTGTLRKYDSLVGYATIGLRLTEVYKLSEVEQPAIGFGAKMAEAFRSGASHFARGFENFLLGVARGWIGWLIFLVIVVVVVLIVLKIRRRRKARAAAAPRPPYPPPGPQPQQQPNPRNPEKPGE